RGHDDVVARAASLQLGIDDLVAVIDVVIDLDAGARLEIGDGVRGDIVGPVVDVEHRFFLCEGRAGGEEGAEGEGERLVHSGEVSDGTVMKAFWRPLADGWLSARRPPRREPRLSPGGSWERTRYCAKKLFDGTP